MELSDAIKQTQEYKGLHVMTLKGTAKDITDSLTGLIKTYGKDLTLLELWINRNKN